MSAGPAGIPRRFAATAHPISSPAAAAPATTATLATPAHAGGNGGAPAEGADAEPWVSPLGKSLLAGALAALGCGFAYAYAMYSTELARRTSLSAGQVVILGVLSQAGMGACMYPAAVAVDMARKRGVRGAVIDWTFLVLHGVMYEVAMLGAGAVVQASTPGAANGGAFSALAFCFFVYGGAFGLTFQHATSVANFNLISYSRSARRRTLASLSLCIALGAVVFTVLYQFALRAISLEHLFYGLAVFYALSTLVQMKWMVRIRPKHELVAEAVPSAPSAAPSAAAAAGTTAGTAPPSYAQGALVDPAGARASSSEERDERTPSEEEAAAEEEQAERDAEEGRRAQNPAEAHAATPSAHPPAHASLSLVALLGSPIVQETLVSGFFGVGVAGCFMSSLGNFQSPELTFALTFTFFCAQAAARLINTIVYAAGEMVFLFALWHVVCLVGVAVYLRNRDDAAALASSALVGASFGGFQSSFPVLASTSFPGGPADYARSLGLVLLVANLGTIIVGEITTALGAGSLADLQRGGFYGMFSLFVALSCLATVLALDLGRRLRNAKRAAGAPLLAPLHRPAAPRSGTQPRGEFGLASDAPLVRVAPSAPSLKDSFPALDVPPSEPSSLRASEYSSRTATPLDGMPMTSDVLYEGRDLVFVGSGGAPSAARAPPPPPPPPRSGMEDLALV